MCKKSEVKKIFIIKFCIFIYISMIILFALVPPIRAAADRKKAVQYCKEGHDKYLIKEKYDVAIKSFTKAIESDSEYGEAYRCRGLAYWHSNEIEKAIKDLINAKEKGIAMGEEGSNLVKLARTNLTTLYLSRNKYEEALKEFEQLVIQDEPNEYALYHCGYILLNKGMYDLAEKELTRTINHKYFSKKNNEVQAKAYRERGISHLYIGNYDKGIDDFKKSKDLNPNDKIVQEWLNIALDKKRAKLNKNISADIDIRIKELSQSNDIKIRKKAAEFLSFAAIGEIPPIKRNEIIDQLLETLSNDTGSVRKAAVTTLLKIFTYYDIGKNIWCRISEQLCSLGQEDYIVVEELINTINAPLIMRSKKLPLIKILVNILKTVNDPKIQREIITFLKKIKTSESILKEIIESSTKTMNNASFKGIAVDIAGLLKEYYEFANKPTKDESDAIKKAQNYLGDEDRLKIVQFFKKTLMYHKRESSPYFYEIDQIARNIIETENIQTYSTIKGFKKLESKLLKEIGLYKSSLKSLNNYVLDHSEAFVGLLGLIFGMISFLGGRRWKKKGEWGKKGDDLKTTLN
ncbi:MAG: tetratricopeptide repeat protein [Candidatus Hodarchaeota archaeon]